MQFNLFGEAFIVHMLHTVIESVWTDKHCIDTNFGWDRNNTFYFYNAVWKHTDGVVIANPHTELLRVENFIPVAELAIRYVECVESPITFLCHKYSFTTNIHSFEAYFKKRIEDDPVYHWLLEYVERTS